jgi:hypothetical protein
MSIPLISAPDDKALAARTEINVVYRQIGRSAYCTTSCGACRTCGVHRPVADAAEAEDTRRDVQRFQKLFVAGLRSEVGAHGVVVAATASGVDYT